MKKMGRKTLRITLGEPIDAIPPDLSDWSLSLIAEGQELEYVFDSQAERTGISALLGKLGELGLSYKDLNTQESSLEDIFVGLVHAGSRETAP